MTTAYRRQGKSVNWLQNELAKGGKTGADGTGRRRNALPQFVILEAPKASALLISCLGLSKASEWIYDGIAANDACPWISSWWPSHRWEVLAAMSRDWFDDLDLGHESILSSDDPGLISWPEMNMLHN